MSFKVSWKVHLLSLIISYSICYIMKDLITNVFLVLFMNNKILDITSNIQIYFLLLLLIVFVLVILIHELVHGIIYQFFGGKVRYGFKVIFAFTQETSGIILHRTKFLIVLLGPLTLISLATLLIPGEFGAIIFLLNFLGSTGDLIMALYLLRTSSRCYIIDRKYGFDIIDKSELLN